MLKVLYVVINCLLLSTMMYLVGLASMGEVPGPVAGICTFLILTLVYLFSVKIDELPAWE